MTRTRIGLVRLSAMGDVVQSLGAIQALQRTGRFELTLVTQTPNLPLFAGLGLATLIPHDRRSGWRGIRASAAALRALCPELVVDLQGNWKSALLARLASRACVGAAASHRQEPTSGILLQRRIAIRGPRHPAHIAHALLRELAPELAAGPPRLSSTPAEVAAVEASLRARGLDPTVAFTVFVVGTPQDNRSWPLTAMRRQAGDEGQPVLWLRGPEEIGVELPAGAIGLAQRGGDLRALIALGEVVRRASGRVVGPDRGATHVLAATGAPTIVLQGPQDPAATSPPDATVWRAADRPHCVPCRSRRCGHPAGPVCMDFVAADAETFGGRG